MRFFDLHCDTPYRIYRENLDFCDMRLDVRAENFREFENFVQVSAIWSDSKRVGEKNYSDFFKIRENYLSQLKKYGINLCLKVPDICNTAPKAILAVEGASLVCKDISRLSVLYSSGVRVLTPLWRGENHIGGGYDTQTGLTSFGKSLVRECERLGIIIDVSHMSERSFWDTAEITEKPFAATHSNSKSVCCHPRNLTDEQFCAIVKRGGIVGINFYPPHVCKNYQSENFDGYIESLCKNINRFLDMGGENNIALGADRDGFERYDGYSQTEYSVRLYDALLKQTDKKTTDDIFFSNAMRFFKKSLPAE